MKRTVLVSVCSIVALLSCKNKSGDTALTRSQMDAKVDSIVAIRLEDLNRQAMEDLDRRMAIEVKVKADSLLNLCLDMGMDLKQAAAPADNTAPDRSNQP